MAKIEEVEEETFWARKLLFLKVEVNTQHLVGDKWERKIIWILESQKKINGITWVSGDSWKFAKLEKTE